MLNRTFSIAPMMDWTDRHDRYFLRLISRHTLLYTEMVTTGALLHGDRERFLAHHPAEHPLALQLGGNDPVAMTRCAKMAEDAGYDEVNINVGCPSDRVQGGQFGACLMATPERVGECVSAMQAAVKIPITVKNRIGIDDQDSLESLNRFVEIISSAGCKTFIIHARKAWLSGISPKQNREVPPLDYQRVYDLKQHYPHLEIIINGGVKTLQEAHTHLTKVDGVMMGREAYQNPYILAKVDAEFYADKQPAISREEIMQQLKAYIQNEQQKGTALSHITRHILGLHKGQYGGKAWRRVLSENARHPDAGAEVIEQANQWLNP